MTVKFAISAAALLLLCQCSPKPAPPPVKPVDMKAPPAAVEPYGFDIALTLSPAAKAKLDRMHEKVQVSAWYSGLPNAASKARAEEDGQIQIGADEPVIEPGTATVHIPGTGLDTSKLQYLDGEPLVLINVYTARKVAEDNLLDCTIFEDTIKKAQAAPVPITCKLIEPDPRQGGAQ